MQSVTKKFISALLCAASITAFSGVGALAFDFPVPDWGELLREKEAMVNETDFELYAEGSIDSAPYYGARLEPRGGAYIGMVTENSRDFRPIGSYLTYIDNMNQKDIYYPANEMIKSDNSVVTIGWTIANMDNVNLDKVRETLDTLNSYGKPMFIRFAYEMNVSSLGDDPEKYKSVFRTVADIVHEYPNFAVVWAPNDLGGLDRPFEYFYPGDEYVDWVGVSCYSIKYFLGNQNTSQVDSIYFMTGDYAWPTNRLKPIIKFMQQNNINKPIMIGEGGVPTNNKFGENLESWSVPRFRNMFWNTIMKYPQVKMINYFNVYIEDEAEKYDISANANSYYGYAADIFREAADSGAYIREAGGSPEFVYQKASDGALLRADGTLVRLYTLAHIPKQPDISVNYSLDGKWFHCSNQIPYTCNLDLSGISDGMHTMKISAANNSKEYTFYKRGLAIRFGSDIDASEVQEMQVNVTLNGQKLEFDRQQPVLQNDTTLVPMRKIFEALDAEVNWNGEEKTAIAQKNGIVIRIPIGSAQIYVNDEARGVGAPAALINDNTMVPVRAISEALGCVVDWDGETKTVIITAE